MIRATIGILAGQVGFDADAQAFIDAAGITDATQKEAINTFVVDLKGYGIWSKMKAIYPFVGGTASTHKYNLKDPRDLDAAFRLVFNGGWTHSSTGATPNGTNGYADTKFNNQGNWTSTNNASMGLYLSTNTGAAARCDMGAGTIISGANSSTIYSRFSGDVYYSGINCTDVVPGSSNTSSIGFFVTQRSSSSEFTRHKRGSSTINDTNIDNVGSNPNTTIFIGAGNNSGSPASYSNRNYQFAFMGDGLSQTEVDNYYTAVSNFNTTLSR